MKELFNNYSGLFAILCYSILFLLFIKLKPRKKSEKNITKEVDLDVNDEYAMVASLMASIIHRNKTHKNIRVISVKEV